MKLILHCWKMNEKLYQELRSLFLPPEDDWRNALVIIVSGEANVL